MSGAWVLDKKWADTCWSDVEAIIRRVAGQIVTVAPSGQEDDQKRARDYIVASGTIACRLRRPTGFRDVTIRCSRPRSGNVTELEKFIRGDVAWMLYGWSTSTGRIEEWVFLDVARVVEERLYRNREPIRNYDGSSEFISLPLDDLIRARAIVDAAVDVPTRLDVRQ